MLDYVWVTFLYGLLRCCFGNWCRRFRFDRFRLRFEFNFYCFIKVSGIKKWTDFSLDKKKNISKSWELSLSRVLILEFIKSTEDRDCFLLSDGEIIVGLKDCKANIFLVLLEFKMNFNYSNKWLSMYLAILMMKKAECFGYFF